MDTSILGRLFEMAPDLMREMELRALILERVAALGPIGRRAMAARLRLAEREVRSAADALKEAGCIVQSAAGMELTEHGRNLMETARAVSRSRRTLSSVEAALAHRLNVERVCVVPGDADMDETVLRDAARAAAQRLRSVLHGASVLAVSGGRTMAMMAQALDAAAPIEMTVVPAQGGMGSGVWRQAGTLAEEIAGRLGGQSRMLHIPDGLSAQTAQELAHLPQVREALELLRHADVLFYGVGNALESAAQRGMGASERETLRKNGAVGEALGFYFDAKGGVVGAKASCLIDTQDMGVRMAAAAVAAGHSKAEAIMAVCAHHSHRLLVTDEGAAHRMMELLRV